MIRLCDLMWDGDVDATGANIAVVYVRAEVVVVITWPEWEVIKYRIVLSVPRFDAFQELPLGLNWQGQHWDVETELEAQCVLNAILKGEVTVEVTS